MLITLNRKNHRENTVVLGKVHFNFKTIDCQIINFTRSSEEEVLEYCDERTT